jgi:hypothetical protein
MQAIHVTSPNAVKDIVSGGLLYGSQGMNNKQKQAAITNNFLDSVRPDALISKNVSRVDCLYAYLVLDGMVIDITDGHSYVLKHWQPTDGKRAIALTVDPTKTYISDLDAYDKVAAAIFAQSSTNTCHDLAIAYWQLLLPLQEAAQYYQPAQTGIKLRSGAPTNLQRNIQRPELMITESISSQALILLR